MTNLRLFRLKEFADDNFIVDENERKFSTWLENTVGKGEIARYERRLVLQTCKNQGLFRKGLTLYGTIKTFATPWIEPLWKTLQEKEKILITSIFPFSKNVFQNLLVTSIF